MATSHAQSAKMRPIVADVPWSVSLSEADPGLLSTE